MTVLGLCVCLLWTGCAGTTGEEKSMNPEEKSMNPSASDAKTGVYQKITAEEAHEMMQNEDVVIVDVRTEEEFRQGHIPNAVLIPNETILFEDPKELPDKSAKILVYCRSGRRSRDAAEKLIEMGYTDVYDFGGIIHWSYELE